MDGDRFILEEALSVNKSFWSLDDAFVAVGERDGEILLQVEDKSWVLLALSITDDFLRPEEVRDDSRVVCVVRTTPALFTLVCDTFTDLDVAVGCTITDVGVTDAVVDGEVPSNSHGASVVRWSSDGANVVSVEVRTDSVSV